MEYDFSVCKGCGLCCKTDGYVFLRAGEAEKIADYLGIDIYEFTEKYCNILDRRSLVLKDKENSTDCIFLNENNLCTIYEVRPKQCKDFPFVWANYELPEGCLLKDEL